MWTAVREMVRSPSRGALLVVLMSTIVIRLWMYRRQQRQRIEPKEWPFLGATLETLQNFNTMHDWILSYFQKGLKTFKVPVPDCTYTYTVDPANVEYILKTRFTNFPKVQTCKPNPYSWSMSLDSSKFELRGYLEHFKCAELQRPIWRILIIKTLKRGMCVQNCACRESLAIRDRCW